MICTRSCSSIAASAAISLGVSSEVPAMRCKVSSPSVFASAASCATALGDRPVRLA
jgi:hypothetical protein